MAPAVYVVKSRREHMIPAWTEDLGALKATEADGVRVSRSSVPHLWAGRDTGRPAQQVVLPPTQDRGSASDYAAARNQPHETHRRAQRQPQIGGVWAAWGAKRARKPQRLRGCGNLATTSAERAVFGFSLMQSSAAAPKFCRATAIS